MSEEKTLGALEQTIQEKAKTIFLEKLGKAIDKIFNDEDLEVLKELEVMETLKFLCVRMKFRESPLEIFGGLYEKDEENIKQFKEKQIKKIGMKLSDDLLEQYKKYGKST